MSRSGAIRSTAGASSSRVMYLSPATMVVSGLPKCWTRWWTLPLRVRWSKLVMSSGSRSGGSGSGRNARVVVGLVAMSDLSGSRKRNQWHRAAVWPCTCEVSLGRPGRQG